MPDCTPDLSSVFAILHNLFSSFNKFSLNSYLISLPFKDNLAEVWNMLEYFFFLNFHLRALSMLVYSADHLLLLQRCNVSKRN